MTAKSSVIVISEDEDCDLDGVDKDKPNSGEENVAEQTKTSPKPIAKRSRFKSTEKKSLISDTSQREPVSPVIQSIKTLKPATTSSNKEHHQLSRNSTTKRDHSRSGSPRTSSFPVHFSQSEFSYAGADFEMIGSDDDENNGGQLSQLKRALQSESNNSKSNGQSLNLGKSTTMGCNLIKDAVSSNRTHHQVKNTNEKAKMYSINPAIRRIDDIQSLQDRSRKKKFLIASQQALAMEQDRKRKKKALLANQQVTTERKRTILPNTPVVSTCQEKRRKRKLDTAEKHSDVEASIARKTRIICKPKINDKNVSTLEPFEDVSTHVEHLKDHVLPGKHVDDHSKAYKILKENFLSEGLPRIIYDSIKQKLDESFEVQKQLLASEQEKLVQLFDERKNEIEEMKNELRITTEAQRCSLQKQMDLLGVIQHDHVSKQHDIFLNIERLKQVKSQLEREIQKKKMMLRLANTRLADKEMTKSIRRRSFYNQARDKMKNKIIATLRKHVEAVFKQTLDKQSRIDIDDKGANEELRATVPMPSGVGPDDDEGVKVYLGLQDACAKHLMNLFMRMKMRLGAHLELEKKYANMRSLHLFSLTKQQLKYEVELKDKNILLRIGEKMADEVLEQYKSVCETFINNQKKIIDENLATCRQRFYRQSLGLSHELQIQCENFYRTLWDCQPNLEGGDNFEAICEYEEVTKRSEQSRHLLQVTSRLNWIKKKRKEAAQSLIDSKISFLTFQQQMARDKLRKLTNETCTAGVKSVPAIVKAVRLELTLLKNLEIKKNASNESKKDKTSTIVEGAIDLTGDDSDNEANTEKTNEQPQVLPGKTSAVLVPILTTTQLSENQSQQQAPRFIMIAGNFASSNALTAQAPNVPGFSTILIPQLNQLNFASQPVLQLANSSLNSANSESSPTTNTVRMETTSSEAQVTASSAGVPVVHETSVVQKNLSNTRNNLNIPSIDLDETPGCAAKSTQSLGDVSKEERRKCDSSKGKTNSSSEVSESADDQTNVRDNDGSSEKGSTVCDSNDGTVKHKKRVQFILPSNEKPEMVNETNSCSGVKMRPVDQFLYDIGLNLVQSQYIDVVPMRGDPVIGNSVRRLRWKSMEVLDYTCNECDFVGTCATTLDIHKKTIHPPPSVLFLPGPLPRIPEILVQAKDSCVRYNTRVSPPAWEEKIECLWCEDFSYWMPCNSPAELPQTSLLARHHLLTCQDSVTQSKSVNNRQLNILLPRRKDLNFVSRPMSMEVDSSKYFPPSPWTCELCHHVFRSKSGVRRHIFRSHPFCNVPQTLICRGCNAKFFTKEGFLNHVIKRTQLFRKTRYACPLKITCPLCDGMSVNQKSWPMHMLITHPMTCEGRLREYVCPFCYPYGPTGPFKLSSQEALEEHLKVWHDMNFPKPISSDDERRTLSTDMRGPLIDAFRSTVESPRLSQLKLFDSTAEICPFCDIRVLLSRMLDHIKRCHIEKSFVSLSRCDTNILKPIVIGLRRCDLEEKEKEDGKGEISITDVTEESETVNINMEWEEGSMTSNDVEQHVETHLIGAQHDSSVLNNHDGNIHEDEVSSSEDETKTDEAESMEVGRDDQKGESEHESGEESDEENRSIPSTIDTDRNQCSGSDVKANLICSEQVEVVCGNVNGSSPRTKEIFPSNASPNVDEDDSDRSNVDELHSVESSSDPNLELISSEQINVPLSTGCEPNEKTDF